ncbi:MAG: hypothetical protein LBP89_09340, partial [Helicobacteraceae bacterium]|nr:hypothetical protein [Helicobacteraceae bacterium]
MLRSLLNQLILAIFTWFLCGVSVYALQTDLLNDPKIVKALQEDEITIVKIEKILTDVNVSKTKQGY